MSFKIGDKVEVIDGLGAGNKGVIVEVDTIDDTLYMVDLGTAGIYWKYEDFIILVASSQNVTNKVKDESQKLKLEMINTLYGSIKYDDITDNVVNNDSNCSHKWKLYNGFTESYEYCELCDKKRGA